MILAPSILSADFGILRSQVQEAEAAGAQWLHIDVMDGQFVPNISFGAVVMQSLRPYSKLFFDVHLMIVEPERYIEDFIKAGADSVTIHVEATKNPAAVLQANQRFGSQGGYLPEPGNACRDRAALFEFSGHGAGNERASRPRRTEIYPRIRWKAARSAGKGRNRLSNSGRRRYSSRKYPSCGGMRRECICGWIGSI